MALCQPPCSADRRPLAHLPVAWHTRRWHGIKRHPRVTSRGRLAAPVSPSWKLWPWPSLSNPADSANRSQPPLFCLTRPEAAGTIGSSRLRIERHAVENVPASRWIGPIRQRERSRRFADSDHVWATTAADPNARRALRRPLNSVPHSGRFGYSQIKVRQSTWRIEAASVRHLPCGVRRTGCTGRRGFPKRCRGEIDIFRGQDYAAAPFSDGAS